jgi:mannose-6-phosphate isomerase-like protein (cupin superfamily)
MPVISTHSKPMSAGNRPDWCDVTAAGIFRLAGSGRFDRHYHDCNEYWLFTRGKAKVWSEGREYYVRAGDILCTRAGDEHDILEIYEPIEGFYFEDALKEGGRSGHLHRSEELAAGHEVPQRPIPSDFPPD